jgi:transcriptional regulator with PAS, ATPase and Fis domain
LAVFPGGHPAIARMIFRPPTASEISHAVGELPGGAAVSLCEEDGLVGCNPDFLRAKEMIRRIARFDTTALITGETGTGKELAAHAIHRLSARRSRPFISVNCAALPEGLLESELFGFERGAFTGALQRQQGKFRCAHEGTLFLDEIGDMSLSAQARILRVLESREVQPLGARTSVPVDVRVVAATHHKLEQLVEEGRFRSDLFFRLSVRPIELPPLRERREDIPELANHFVRELNIRYGLDIQGIDDRAMELLCLHDWPGNIRQLRNAVEGAFVVCVSQIITFDDFQGLQGPNDSTHSGVAAVAPKPPGFSYLSTPREADRLMDVLQATRWNKSKAAKRLHWSRMTLYRKIAKYGLSQEGTIDEEDTVVRVS